MDPTPLNGWLAAARAVHLTACLLIGATWFFDCLIVPRPAVHRWRRIAIWLMSAALPTAFASGAIWFVLIAADMNDVAFAAILHDRAALGVVWSNTHFGRVWQIHGWFLVATAGAAVAWIFVRRISPLGLLAGAGLVGTLAWAGHGDTGPAPRWHLTADVIHLITSSIWPAGLVPFVILIVSVSRSGIQDRGQLAYTLTRRFSVSSFAAVGGITATGIVNSWALVGSLSGVTSTGYGRLLLIKIVLFSAMVVLGAVNRLVFTPRIQAGDKSGRGLAISVSAEIVLGTLVLAAVGLLGLLEPARRPPEMAGPGNAAARQAAVYRSRGRVVSVGPHLVELDHEDISGYMGAMRMQFSVSDTRVIATLHPADPVAFELTAQPDGSVSITKIEALPVGTKLHLADRK